MTEAAGGTRAAPAIAVVGLACRFPDADDPAELLDTVLTGRRAFRRLPPARFSLADYYQSNPATADATYSTRAALLSGWQFDCAAFGVEPAVYLASDPAHWLALETSARALAAAGLPAAAGLNRDRTGVFIGNTLAGDTSRANALRLRWPYVRRALAGALAAAGLPAGQTAGVLSRAEHRYLAPFPVMGPHTLAGSMPATIAATISAYFGFRGGSQVIDAACSSSLQAVAAACAALTTGDLDAAVAGGVDLSLDPLELIGLARAGLLATTDVRIYDRNPSGYLPGEGCGVLILMRAADARASGLPVHAEIVGWGSSGGSVPGQPQTQVDCQLLAMGRAYERAGVDPADVGYVEGHGAATAGEDNAELQALALIRSRARRPAALGSIKANIGHAGAAAGAAGLIKAVLAVSAGVIPPATGASRPHELIADGDAGLALPRSAQDWDASHRWAAVGSAGIAGSNVHFLIRNDSVSTTRPRHWPRSADPESDPDAVQPRLPKAAEPLPFLLHAPDRDGLAATLSRLADTAAWLSDAELLDLACALGRNPARQGPARVAFAAARQEQLAALAREAVEVLAGLVPGPLAVTPGTFASDGADGRVTLLLSADPPDGAGEVAAAALVRDVGHCLDMLRWLDSLDVAATSAVGHGPGLLAGLAWAGILGEEEVVEIAGLRAQFLVTAGAQCTGAPDAGTGSWPPADGRAAAALRASIAQRFRFGPPRRRLISTVTGAEVESVDDAIDLICRGFSDAGRLAEAVAAGAAGATLVLDTGPSPTLAQAAAASAVPTLSLRSGFADPVNSARVAAALFAAGALGAPAPLFAGWQTRPIDIWRDHLFLSNPCEVGPARLDAAERRAGRSVGHGSDDVRLSPGEGAGHRADRDQAPDRASALDGDGPRGIAANDRGSHAEDPAPHLAPWTRCFTEVLRPAPQPAAPLPSRSWRVYATARSQQLSDLAGQFTADPSAPRTLAIVEDPADERSRTTALAAARDATGTGELVVLTTSAGFTAFFATLHAEHPSIGVTVLRLRPGAASAAAVAPFTSAAPGQFRELVIGPTGAASEPELTEVELTGGAGFPLGGDDVILISRTAGGAGLALARVLACAGTGIAVVGRAGRYDDSGLIAGLEELRSAGARIGYEVIGIDEPASLAGAIGRIEARLGQVTALVCGASPDQPVPLSELTDADVARQPAAVTGALDQLAASIPAGQLKLVVSVGTVAGRYGLAGSGLHTLGCGALASRAAEVAVSAGCRHLHLDLPAWAAQDLGEQPGYGARLAAAGTPAIALSAASRQLLKIMTTPGLPSSLAVHGRIDRLASTRPPALTGVQLAAAGLPHGGRFLRETAIHYPGVELICSARLSLASDPYLADYQIDGLPVLPPAMALEALAQAASVLAGQPLRYASAVRLDAPVVIPAAASGETVLRVFAQRRGDAIAAVLRCSDSSYQVDHAAAVFPCQPPELPASPLAAAALTPSAAGLVDGAELYGPVCFQTGRFRRLALLPEVTPRSGRAVARGTDEQEWYAPGSLFARTEFLLGSPGLNDAVFQVLQACVPHRRVRVAGCESAQFAGRDVTGPVEIRVIAEPVRPASAANGRPVRLGAAVPGQPGAPDVEQDAGPLGLRATAQAPAGPAALAGTGGTGGQETDGQRLAARSRHARKARGVRLRVRTGLAATAPDDDVPPAGVQPAIGEAVLADDAVPADSDGAAVSRQLWAIEAVTADGELLAAWHGVRLRDAGPMPQNGAWPPVLLAVFLERSATGLGLDAGLRVTVTCGQPATVPAQSGPSCIQPGPRAATGPDGGRHAGPDRPGLNAVSMPGTGRLAGYTLTLRAPVPVAAAWITADQGSRQHRPATGLAIVYGQLRAELAESPALLAARLEAIRACLARAGGQQAGSNLRVTGATSDGWVALAAGRARIACTVVDVSGVGAPVAIALLTMRKAHARAPAARLAQPAAH